MNNDDLVIDIPTTDVSVNKNDYSKVKFRQQVLTVQNGIQEMINNGEIENKAQDCTLTHLFTPVDPAYGCCTYARQIFLPKGTLVIGKIHKHQHLNFILKGKVSVSTEHGKKIIEAPASFISEVGLKRAVVAEEDTIWVTVHLTKYSSEEDLAKVEDEVIAPTYEDMGLISSVEALNKLENKEC
jgi:hypothetical protein